MRRLAVTIIDRRGWLSLAVWADASFGHDEFGAVGT